jgi:hypothetical protein
VKYYRVQASINDKEYGLSQKEYDVGRGQRFELIKNQENSTIYLSEEIADLAIYSHKRTRQDQLVQSYNLIKV